MFGNRLCSYVCSRMSMNTATCLCFPKVPQQSSGFPRVHGGSLVSKLVIFMFSFIWVWWARQDPELGVCFSVVHWIEMRHVTSDTLFCFAWLRFAFVRIFLVALLPSIKYKTRQWEAPQSNAKQYKAMEIILVCHLCPDSHNPKPIHVSPRGPFSLHVVKASLWCTCFAPHGFYCFPPATAIEVAM